MSYESRDIFGCAFHRGNCGRSGKDRDCFARASSENLSEPKANDKPSALRNLSEEIVNDREFPAAHSLGPSVINSPLSSDIASEGLPAQPRLPSSLGDQTPRTQTLPFAPENSHLASPSAYEMGQHVERCEKEKTWCANHVTSDSSLKVAASGDPSAAGTCWNEGPLSPVPNEQTIISANSHNAGSIDVLLVAFQSLEEKVLHQLRDVPNTIATMLHIEMKQLENDLVETLQTVQKNNFPSASGLVEEKNEERKNGLDGCVEGIVEVEPTSTRQRDFSVTDVGQQPNVTNMSKPPQPSLDAKEPERAKSTFFHRRGSKDSLDWCCGAHAPLAAKILGKTQTFELGVGLKDMLGELNTPGVDLDGVEKLYKTTGWAQALVRSTHFQHLVLLVIFVNAAYLGVDCVVDNPSNLYEGPWIMIVVSNLLCLFFCFEWVTRFCAFESTRKCLLDAWFKFDTVVVFFMVAETWLMAPLIMATGADFEIGAVGLLRLLRLLKLARMTDFAHSVPELVTILKGIYCATRSVASTMLLNLLLMYTFSIAIFSFLRDEHALNKEIAAELFFSFGSLSDSLLALANIIFMLDGTGFVLCKLMYAGTFNAVCSAILLWIFFLIAAVAILGMLMGVFVDVVQSIAANERDRYDTFVIKETILGELVRQDDGDGNIDKRELQKILNDDKSKYIFQHLKVNRLFLIEMQDLYFPSDRTLIPISTIVEMMLMSRGDNPIDVQLLSCGLAHVHEEISALRQGMSEMLDR